MRRILALIFAVALLATACGGGSDDNADTETDEVSSEFAESQLDSSRNEGDDEEATTDFDTIAAPTPVEIPTTVEPTPTPDFSDLENDDEIGRGDRDDGTDDLTGLTSYIVGDSGATVYEEADEESPFVSALNPGTEVWSDNKTLGDFVHIVRITDPEAGTGRDSIPTSPLVGWLLASELLDGPEGADSDDDGAEVDLSGGNGLRAEGAEQTTGTTGGDVDDDGVDTETSSSGTATNSGGSSAGIPGPINRIPVQTTAPINRIPVQTTAPINPAPVAPTPAPVAQPYVIDVGIDAETRWWGDTDIDVTDGYTVPRIAYTTLERSAPIHIESVTVFPNGERLAYLTANGSPFGWINVEDVGVPAVDTDESDAGLRLAEVLNIGRVNPS